MVGEDSRPLVIEWEGEQVFEPVPERDSVWAHVGGKSDPCA